MRGRRVKEELADLERLDRQVMRVVIIGAIALLLLLAFILPLAAAEDQPKLPALSCDDVRRVVSEHGKIKATAMAIEAGAAWSQIREARKCLK